MKLWDKEYDIDKVIENFTVGKDRELDLLLATHDILGTLAHIQMLESIGLLEKSELEILTKELQGLFKIAQKGELIIEDGVEDIHSQVELLLTQKLGDVGKKIHSGRSRNDQVLLDIKLFVRSEIEEIVGLTSNLFDTLIALSEKHKQVLLPGYTHYQVAMPSSFGLWFGAYAESLVDDLVVLKSAFDTVNKNPLGSAAGYGSSFPLNRKMTTELLGFEDLNYNVVYAQMGRGKAEKVVSDAISTLAMTLGKMAQDVCLYNSQNYGFISFPDHLTTGSSIMPHKKNPDVFELIRATCNQIQSTPNQIGNIISNLASGYHRDYQLTKEIFFPLLEQIKSCLKITDYMLQNISVNENILLDKKYKYLFTVEKVNDLVLQGIPFRDAYKQIGMEVQNGSFTYDKDIKHTHEGSIGNLCNNEISSNMKKIIKDFPFQHIHTTLKKLL